MAKRFRLACPVKAYLENPDRTKRPPKPPWLQEECKEHSTRNQKRSYEYWNQIYWATPPWLNEEMIEQMKELYLTAEGGEEVDHIVPLKGKLACGFHVPWNLQKMLRGPNQAKSNHMWPGHPYENLDLFDD